MRALLLPLFTAVLAAAFIPAIAYSIAVGNRKGGAEQTITRLCAQRGGGVFYDVQDENKMVYACNDDHVLQVRAY